MARTASPSYAAKRALPSPMYYGWSKEFLEAGKRRLAGDTARAATSDEVKDLRSEAATLKEVVAEPGAGNPPAQKKHDRGWGRRRMRYPASEKAEIIKIVEQSHLSARRRWSRSAFPEPLFTAGMSNIRPVALRRWKTGHRSRIASGTASRRQIRTQIIDLALEQPELSPRELAVRFTDSKAYFVSEATVYRLLKAHDLITSPAFIVMKAANEFKDKTTAPNQMWQTDFTYFKITGWGWYYLSTVLDDFSRYIIAWKLCTTMKAEDVTDTLESGIDGLRLDQMSRFSTTPAAVRQRLQLHLRGIGRVVGRTAHEPRPRRALSSPDPGQD